MVASEQGHTATVQALIQAGADLNLQDKSGLTALMIASHEGHMASVRALIGVGADPNLQDTVCDCNSSY
jgi:ankyrin repeat protein